jgi:hypothetical protein
MRRDETRRDESPPRSGSPDKGIDIFNPLSEGDEKLIFDVLKVTASEGVGKKEIRCEPHGEEETIEREVWGHPEDDDEGQQGGVTHMLVELLRFSTFLGQGTKRRDLVVFARRLRCCRSVATPPSPRLFHPDQLEMIYCHTHKGQHTPCHYVTPVHCGSQCRC